MRKQSENECKKVSGAKSLVVQFVHIVGREMEDNSYLCGPRTAHCAAVHLYVYERIILVIM